MLIETDLRPLEFFRSVEGSAIAATLPSTLTPDSTGESGVLGYMGIWGVCMQAELDASKLVSVTP